MQYATTSDGARIAFGRVGSGPPLLRLPSIPFSHQQLEWRDSAFFEGLAERCAVVTFDPRGCGLSDRGVADYSLDARVSDIEAVAERAELRRFTLHGVGFSVAPVVAYAVRHPERVDGVILDNAIVSGEGYRQASAQGRALGGLIEDWDAFLETIAFTATGQSLADARRYTDYLRACVTQEEASRIYAEVMTDDVRPLLPQISMPTLILQHGDVRTMPLDLAREMAAAIPNARLSVLEGQMLDDMDHALLEILDFIGADAPARHGRAGAFRTILFTDVEAHTSMMQRLGDESGRAVLRDYERITRQVLHSHGGDEVKSMGDGLMASFSSVTNGVECAVALQRAFAQHNALSREPLLVRVGLSAGEPIAEEGDYFGATVILASRIAAQAAGGEILASVAVRELCAGKGFTFADRGDSALRGFDEPVRLHEVRWQEV